MITILLGILCSTGILILFRLLPRLGANTSHTIFLSYAISTLLGFLILPISSSVFQFKWLLAAALEGIAFYVVFHLMARSALTSGVAFTSVASKMSVVIPITIGLTFLGDSLNTLIISGVLLGLLAVVLTVGSGFEAGNWRWPMLVFLGTGVIDSSFKLYQVWGLTEALFPVFIVGTFAFAFVTALSTFLYTKYISAGSHEDIAMPSLYAGFGLGLLNLGTVFFLLKALSIVSLDSTVVYALNSIGIVLMSMLIAIGLFRESISPSAYLGIFLALLSIVCVYLSHRI